MELSTSLVVPTLGRSPWLAECLRALRREAGEDGEVIVVAQGGCAAAREGSGGLAHRWIEVPRPLGFAAAADLGIDAAEATWVGLVNDDAVVEPGWLAVLRTALQEDPCAAAAQGVNVQSADPSRCDGWGLAWNPRLQAVQLGHGEPPPDPSTPVGEVFGVSATAALFRRSALLAVALPAPGLPRRPVRPPAGRLPGAGGSPPPAVFDPGLGTYYEDADLAVRLRAAGWRALSVPAARVRHAGAATAGSGSARWRRVYGNRHLVVARALGRVYWRRLPGMLGRDAVDLLRGLARGQGGRSAGILGGWGRAVRRLPGFAHGGPPFVALEELVASPPGPAQAGEEGS